MSLVGGSGNESQGEPREDDRRREQDQRVAVWRKRLRPWTSPAVILGAIGLPLVIIGTCKSCEQTEIARQQAIENTRLQRGKLEYESMNVVSGNPGFNSPLQLAIVFRNNGRETARGAHFSFSYVLVDSVARETPLPIEWNSQAGDMDVAPGATFSQLVAELSSTLKSDEAQAMISERSKWLVETGRARLRLRARVDYVARMPPEGAPELDVAAFCRDYDWGFNSWSACVERTPGLPPIT